MEKRFIDHFYVGEDLKAAPLKVHEFTDYEDAMKLYFRLPVHQLKALGVQNTNIPFPGSLDLVQCRNGVDTILKDYLAVPGWNNTEILGVLDQLRSDIRNTDVCVAYRTKVGYLTIQTTDGGYDYSFYDPMAQLWDGGRLDAPEAAVDEAAAMVLPEIGMTFADAEVVDYDWLQEKIEGAAMRTAALRELGLITC